MQRSQKVLIGGGVCILAIGIVAATAGPTIYRDFIAAPAAEAPTISTDDEMLQPKSESLGPETNADSDSAVSLDPTLLAGEWTVVDGSEAGYRVNEVLNGTDVTVTGRTDEVTGSFVIASDGLTLDSAILSVDVASIATDSSQRDAYFRDQALRANKHPAATFTLTEPVELDAAPGSGEVIEAEATGTLTIAGVTKPATATVQVRSDGSTAEIAGSIPVTFDDFGVTAPNLGFVSVEPTGFVEFQLRADSP